MIRNCMYENNRKSNVILTAEKLSGRGVLCSKNAVHLCNIFPYKVNCIFIAENINNSLI